MKKTLQNTQETSSMQTPYDLISLAPKWSDQDHLRIALKEHLADAQGALGGDSEAKELMDLAMIAQAYRNAHVPPELQAERWKKFQSTAKYPSLAAEKLANFHFQRGYVETLTKFGYVTSH